MQCNAMYVDVRPYGMKSVSLFFFYFFSQYRSPVGIRNTWTRQHFSFLSVKNEWMDRQVSSYQPSFSSIAQSSLSVRPESQPKKRKKNMLNENTCDPIEVIHSMAKKNLLLKFTPELKKNVTDGTPLKKVPMFKIINITFGQYAVILMVARM
jgi:hypothetical protein